MELPRRARTRASTRSCSCAPIEFSEEAHRGQTRNSGEPYVIHCVEVAKILADLQLDTHDRGERVDPRRRRGHGGHAGRRRARSSARRSPPIVDGLTKIAKLPNSGSNQERQVENYRKLLLSIAKDARVIIVKLADRLHNMRTLELSARGEAAAHRAGDARPVRAARAPLRYGEDAVGARGPRVQAPRARGVQGAGEAGRAEARRARGADRSAQGAARRAS